VSVMTDHENPYAGQDSVLLDIGGDVGALVVTAPASSQGREVELRAVTSRGPSHSHPHVAVVARPTRSGPVYSLVYPAVVEGVYELALLPEGKILMTVFVRGSEVTQVDWAE
jgi:hypothetical protein